MPYPTQSELWCKPFHRLRHSSDDGHANLRLEFTQPHTEQTENEVCLGNCSSLRSVNVVNEWIARARDYSLWVVGRPGHKTIGFGGG